MSEECFEVEVIYPYQAAEKNQISLRRKEKILVFQTDASGWWIGKNSRGQVGIFPSTYTSLGAKSTSNKDNPFDGVDKDNKAVLCKIIEQLHNERKQLQAERDGLQEELLRAREKLDTTIEEISTGLSPKVGELSPSRAPADVHEDVSAQENDHEAHENERSPISSARPEEDSQDERFEREEILRQEVARLRSEKDSISAQMNEQLRQLRSQLDLERSQHQAALESLSKQSAHSKQDQEDVLRKLQSRVDVLERENTGLRQTAKAYEELKELHRQFEGLPALVTELKKLYQGESAERRRLYSLIQDLKGKVRVFCRLRPLLPAMDNMTHPQCVHATEDGFRLRIDDPNKLVHFYDFDTCFGPQSTQKEVFDAVQPVIASVLDGYNVCVFCYGQTGSGKTYTMEGTSGNPGISYMTVQFLFDQIAIRSEAYLCEVSMTCVEVYNDQVYDLLSGSRDDKKELRMVNGSCQVVDTTVIGVSNPADVTQPLHRALGNRSTNSTLVNERSSRSHCVLTFYVTETSKVSGTKIFGKLHLIDLAGSERLSKSKAEGDRLMEANCINKSLSNLGRVVCALHRKQAHVPFRDSKLTYLLQDSLSGDSKTILIANVSPSLDCLGETYSTVAFATSVQKLELGEARRHVVEAGNPPTAVAPTGSVTASSPATTTNPSGSTPTAGRQTQRFTTAVATGPKSLNRSMSHNTEARGSTPRLQRGNSAGLTTKIPTPPSSLYQSEAFTVITNTTKPTPTTSAPPQQPPSSTHHTMASITTSTTTTTPASLTAHLLASRAQYLQHPPAQSCDSPISIDDGVGPPQPSAATANMILAHSASLLLSTIGDGELVG